jgi:hypothetical protein
VRGQPDITIPELGAKMGIKQNYLYRVLPGLKREGKVTKRGSGWAVGLSGGGELMVRVAYPAAQRPLRRDALPKG